MFHNLVPYGADILLGFGGSILLVTSLSMTADLIGPHVVSWENRSANKEDLICYSLCMWCVSIG